MTGYARVSARDGNRRIVVDIAAVNNRFLKLQFKLPEQLQSLRQKLEETIKKRVMRGSLTITILHDPPEEALAITFNRELARRYARELEAFARELGLEPPRSLDFFTNLPGLFQSTETLTTVSAEDSALILDTVEQSLGRLETDRRREGRSLARDLTRRHRQLVKQVKAIQKRAPAVVESFSRRFLERLNEMLANIGHQAAPEDILREVATYAERVDITEELTRLEAHLEHFADILAKGGECGKRLEFLLQEIHREVNTIGSKAGSTDISPHVVAIKGEVEKIREQVQNIE